MLTYDLNSGCEYGIFCLHDHVSIKINTVKNIMCTLFDVVKNQLLFKCGESILRHRPPHIYY